MDTIDDHEWENFKKLENFLVTEVGIPYTVLNSSFDELVSTDEEEEDGYDSDNSMDLPPPPWRPPSPLLPPVAPLPTIKPLVELAFSSLPKELKHKILEYHVARELLPHRNPYANSHLFIPPVFFHHGEMIDLNGEFKGEEDLMCNYGSWIEYQDPDEDSEEEQDWAKRPKLDVEEINFRKFVRNSGYDKQAYEEIQAEIMWREDNPNNGNPEPSLSDLEQELISDDDDNDNYF